jgi:hypothetical protein
LRSLIVQTGNVRKRPSETGRTTDRMSHSNNKVIKPPTHGHTNRCKDKNNSRIRQTIPCFFLFLTITIALLLIPIPPKGYSEASYGSYKAFLWGYRRYPQDPWRWFPRVLEAICTTRRCHRYDPWERLPTPLEGFPMTDIQNLRGEGSKPHTRFSLRERTVVWRGYLERPSPRSPDKRTAGKNNKRVSM